jgi:2-keto-4-pentenoate hydratase/2-oxohepta-3-ene-1,7-dioic acid hydratase in catechol pathway
MKLLTYASVERGSRLGICLNDQVYDVQDTAAKFGVSLPADMLGLLNLSREGMATLQGVIERAKTSQTSQVLKTCEVSILAPIARPPKILALAGNYAEHVRESGWVMPEKIGVTPRIFVKPATSVIGPGQPIITPRLSKEVDYELEMAAVIGTRGRYIEIEKALAHVAGYMIFNDVSARSLTIAEGRTVRPWDDFFDWLNGKWFDSFAAMGPYLVTSDEVGDPQQLKMRLTVNGETRQDATTGMMVFDVAELVAFASGFMTLEPGDIIATGTPSGVGKARGIFLKPGDVVAGYIEKLGTLTNPVKGE